MTELVSIIIPVYNIENYIERCILSCRKQSYCNIEIIAVDDGSYDQSNVILNDLKIKDSRINIITKKNGGVVAARKDGLKISNGKYIFFLDGDDYIPENAISLLVKKSEETDADVVIGDYTQIDENRSLIEKKTPDFGVMTAKEFIPIALRNNQLYLCFRLIKKSTLDKIIIPEDITLGEDSIAFAQVLINSRLIAKCNQSIYYYYRRQNSVTMSPSAYDLRNSYRSAEVVLEILNEYSEDQHYINELNLFKLNHILWYLKKSKVTGLYQKKIKLSGVLELKNLVISKYKLRKIDVLALLLSPYSQNLAYGIIFLEESIRKGLMNIKRKIWTLWFR